jgi:hypothetical protein
MSMSSIGRHRCCAYASNATRNSCHGLFLVICQTSSTQVARECDWYLMRMNEVDNNSDVAPVTCPAIGSGLTSRLLERDADLVGASIVFRQNTNTSQSRVSA